MLKNTPFIKTLILIVLFNTNIFPQDKEIPFEFLPNGFILIKVTVGDNITGSFILDTGSGIHMFSKKFSNKVNPKNAGIFTVFRHNGDRISLGIFTVSKIGMENIVEQEPYIGIWDALDNLGIDGIISLKLFEKQPFTINFINKTIIIENPGSLEKLSEKGVTVPLELQIYRDKAIDIFANFRLNDKVTTEFEIDTGSGREIIIDARYMEIFGIDTVSSSVKKIESKNINGEKEVIYRTGINKISLPGVSDIMLSNPQVIFKKNLIYDGIIGVEIWLDKKLTIDIPGNRLIINTE